MQQRDRSSLGFQNHSHGIFKQFVLRRFFIDIPRGFDLHQFRLVLGFGGGSNQLHAVANFLVVDVGALAAHGFAGTGGKEQHVALAEEQFGTVLIQHDTAVHLAGDTERDLARHVRFDQTRDDCRLRALRGENQMDADGSGFLGQSYDERFNFLAAGHHQVRQLIDDDHDVRQELRDLRFFFRRAWLETFDQFLARHLVVIFDIANARLGQEFVALVHLVAGPIQHARGAAGIVDDRAHQMWNVLERSHFHDLRIDKNELDHVRPLQVHDRHDDRVDADRLTRSGGTGDQTVGHGGQIGDEWFTAGIFAEEQWNDLLAHRFRR